MTVTVRIEVKVGDQSTFMVSRALNGCDRWEGAKYAQGVIDGLAAVQGGLCPPVEVEFSHLVPGVERLFHIPGYQGIVGVLVEERYGHLPERVPNQNDRPVPTYTGILRNQKDRSCDQ